MAAKKAPPVVSRPQPGLDNFEKGVKALGRKDFSRARDIFDALIAAHPEEQDLVERAKAYRTLCDRALEKAPTFRPKTFDELLHHGVYLHNRGEYPEALKALQKAAEIHPRNEHVLYCLAATAARAGDSPAALKSLRQAVAASPANRAQARQDPDFDTLREHEEFVSIVYPKAS
jgi:tetratricopeptide (TPR) repeat protein